MPEDINTIYNTFDKNLYRTDNSQYLAIDEVSTNGIANVSPNDFSSGGAVNQQNQYVGALVSGKQTFSNNESGYILGIDKGIPKFYIGNTTNYLNWDGSSLVISGNISATTGTIGGFTITATDLSATSGGNTTTLSSGSVAFSAGPTGSPTVTISQAGILTATGAIINGYAQTNIGTFGGDGSDGALTITSGTTTVNLGGAAVVTKNYTSISITGTGTLAFSNPHANGTVIVIKSQGAVTLTSSSTPMIDARNTGAAGGAGGTRSSAGGGASGSSGTDGKANAAVVTHFGVLSNGNAQGAGGAIGTVGFPTDVTTLISIFGKYPSVYVGAGGGGGGCSWNSGGSGTTVGGTGGNGGGCLIIECKGAFNFTTTGGISVSGSVGGNGSITGSPTNYNATGGGGGGAGSCFVFYNTLTSASGTITSAGGVGGNSLVGGAGAGNNAGAGGGGSNVVAGNSGANNITTSVKSGGDGGSGYSVMASNTLFA